MGFAGGGKAAAARHGAYQWFIDTWCAGWRRWNIGRRTGFEGTRESAQDAAVQVLLGMIQEGVVECGCCVQDKLRRERELRWEMDQRRGAQAAAGF